jgi:glycosyltransferase involved in cell wall biosynthesis
MSNKTRLCIVSPYSYPLFNPQCVGVFGGWEVRTSLIAKELARRGKLEVCLIVWDHGQPPIEQRAGVTLYSWQDQNQIFDNQLSGPQREVNNPPVLTNDADAIVAITEENQMAKPLTPVGYKLENKHKAKSLIPWQLWLPARELVWAARSAGKTLAEGRHVLSEAFIYATKCLRGAVRLIYLGLRRGYERLRKVHTVLGTDHIVWKKSIAFYDQINADIYLVPGNSPWAAEAAYYCRLRGKTYVFLAGSDLDYNVEYTNSPWLQDVYSFSGQLRLYAIEQAALHIVQSERQALLLRQNYQRSSVVVRNPIDLTLSYQPDPQADTILWVGRADNEIKRPELILELARRLPEYPFVIVLAPLDSPAHERCLELAARLPNVKTLGLIPFQEIEQHFAQAKLLINTSTIEGFPNTFLQAAKYGRPIVSAKVDPGEMLSRHGCGISCNDEIDLLEQAVRRLMTNSELYRSMSARCLEYVKKYHDLEQVVAQYEEILSAQVAGGVTGQLHKSPSPNEPASFPALNRCNE